jgi:hypothetical protein
VAAVKVKVEVEIVIVLVCVAAVFVTVTLGTGNFEVQYDCAGANPASGEASIPIKPLHCLAEAEGRATRFRKINKNTAFELDILPVGDNVLMHRNWADCLLYHYRNFVVHRDIFVLDASQTCPCPKNGWKPLKAILTVWLVVVTWADMKKPSAAHAPSDSVVAHTARTSQVWGFRAEMQRKA